MPYPKRMPDLHGLKVFPLAERQSLTSVENILVNPASPPAPLSPELVPLVAQCADRILAARDKSATVSLIYGAHLLRNGAALILGEMMRRGWLTHLATNGAGTIHDWEYAFLGRSTESVEKNVAAGCFGTWDETGRNIHLALLAGGVAGLGYGASLGKYIAEDGIDIPTTFDLERLIKESPGHKLTANRAELLRVLRELDVTPPRINVEHRWKHTSILGQAWQAQVPVTIHPGIGYDIISCHPLFNGAVIGRAAERDFCLFVNAVESLDNGVVMSVGSAIMGPQVFEKSLSCVHNLRFQTNRPAVRGHSFYVVDLQESGGWDWTQGEPPKTNPAYYLRFCKSFSRMGGEMQYLCSDNLAFIHNLYHALLNRCAATALNK